MPTDHRNNTWPNRTLPGPIQELRDLRWNAPLLWLLHLENKTIFKGTKWLMTGFWWEWGGAEVVFVIWIFRFSWNLTPPVFSAFIYKACLLSICCMPSTVCASTTCNRETWTLPLENSSYKRCHWQGMTSVVRASGSLQFGSTAYFKNRVRVRLLPTPPSILSQDLPRVLWHHDPWKYLDNVQVGYNSFRKLNKRPKHSLAHRHQLRPTGDLCRCLH